MPEERKLLPFLTVLLPAVLSGRSITALRMCHGDVIAGSLAVFVGLIFGIILHAGGVTLGLLTIGLPLEDAVKIAAIPALALAVLDIKFQQARDQEKALKIARETRPDLPRTLQGGFGFALRPLVSLTSGLVLGTFVLLALFQGDTNDLLRKWQEAEDEQIAEGYARDIDTQRETLSIAVARAKSELDTAKASDPRSTTKAAKERLEKERADIAGLIPDLQDSLHKALAERDEQRGRMACEETGIVDDACPDASGKKGRGTNYDLASDRADRADSRAISLADQISALERKLVKLDEQIQALEISPDTPVAIAKASAALADAEKALREFDPAARTAELVAAHPGRRVYDPDSFANRFLALKALFDEIPALWAFAMGIEALGVALESIVFLGGIIARPSEYHVARARLYVEAAERELGSLRTAFVEQQAERKEYRDARDLEDPRVLNAEAWLTRKLAEDGVHGAMRRWKKATRDVEADHRDGSGIAAE